MDRFVGDVSYRFLQHLLNALIVGKNFPRSSPRMSWRRQGSKAHRIVIRRHPRMQASAKFLRLIVSHPASLLRGEWHFLPPSLFAHHCGLEAIVVWSVSIPLRRARARLLPTRLIRPNPSWLATHGTSPSDIWTVHRSLSQPYTCTACLSLATPCDATPLYVRHPKKTVCAPQSFHVPRDSLHR